jgi:uncharacterized protein (TIGR02300 family)
MTRGPDLANPELGAKQICPTCSSKFYDLTRRPAHCPKCGSEFDPEEALRSRRVRPRAPLPEEEVEEVKPPEVDPDDEGFGTEAEETPELDEGVEAEPLVVDDEDGDDAAPAAPDEAVGVDFAEEEDLEEADTKCRSSRTRTTTSPKTRSTACPKKAATGTSGRD